MVIMFTIIGMVMAAGGAYLADKYDDYYHENKNVAFRGMQWLGIVMASLGIFLWFLLMTMGRLS